MKDKEKAVLAAIQTYDPEAEPSERVLSALLIAFSDDEILEGGVGTFVEWETGYHHLCVTNKPLLLIEIDRPKGKFVGAEEYPYSKINSVGFAAGRGMFNKSEITINFAGRDIAFDLANSKRLRVKEFAELIRSKLPSSVSPNIQNGQLTNTNPLVHLERLVQLKTQGLLSEEEFKDCKGQVARAIDLKRCQ